MAEPHATSWSLIEGAAAGCGKARDRFALAYEPVLRAYLGARWRQSPRSSDVDDAAQEIFVECFREGGLLDRVDRDRGGGFRAYLYGAARNVARRYEERAGRKREGQGPTSFELRNVEQDETSLSRVFDRAWARSLLREAFALLKQKAGQGDGRGARSSEILELRYSEGKPIRDIAAEWRVDAKKLHREFDRAKREFRDALTEVVAFHSPGSAAEIEARCSELLAIFS